ncbi:MAG: hypothetical protein COB51_02910 [Moraxellaceae bacterium]|nr:MAG: hypothetical protein COB51_02910 [Moraxellaceae bacterium]
MVLLINKRRLEREQLNRYIQVFDRESGSFAGFLVDVTTEGVMLGSLGPLNMSATSHFSIKIPRESGDADEVVFDAQGIWGNKGENSIFYETGFRFLGVPMEVKSRLERMIKNFRIVGHC